MAVRILNHGGFVAPIGAHGRGEGVNCSARSSIADSFVAVRQLIV
jgi:hypothetical protein